MTVLDSGDFAAGVRPPGSNERQIVVVKDPDYRGWENGSVVHRLERKEYKLTVDGVDTECISHDAEAEVIRSKIQTSLDSGSGGSVNVFRVISEADAPNWFSTS